jgi:hypothetical protein
VLIHFAQHGINVVAKRHRMASRQCRHYASARTGCLYCNGINSKAVLRINRFTLRRQECFGDHHQNVVRSVAERDAFRRAAMLASERLLQFESIGIRI